MCKLICIFIFFFCVAINAADKPNVILIFTDDQGYGDLGCYGNTKIKTPNLDQMAKEGIRFTDFYVGANFCSPSRASLLTGCYPGRIGFGPGVLRPDADYGLNSSEMTMAEMFKSAGYATKCIGKWHIGFKKPFLPQSQGFDEYFGILHNMDKWEVDDFGGKMPLYKDEKIIKEIDSPAQLTEWYTEETLEFIERNKEKPFFIYLPHTMAHNPLAVTEKFAGKSKAGLYGDVAECLDWSTGQILNKIKELKLEKNTLVIYLSDNGGHKGRNGVLRGAKGQCWEGGMRVPCIIWGPGMIQAGKVSEEIVSAVDLMPTFAKWLNVDLPNKTDGVEITDLLTEKAGKGREHFFYFDGVICMAVRDKRWKLHKTIHGDFSLYDLKNDIGEKVNVVSENPQVVQRLRKVMLDYEAELNSNRRMAGRVID